MAFRFEPVSFLPLIAVHPRGRTRRHRGPVLSAMALGAFALPAAAQSLAADAPLPASSASASASAPATQQLDAITVTGRSPTGTASVAGFGDVPLARSPLQAAVVSEQQLRDSGGTGLAALTRFDASISDAYNAVGYWTTFTVRGFAIDNRYNFLRDGLPINAETSLPLDNKSRIELLKGTSGIQSGTSAPGGLVNLVVKRPEGTTRSVSIGFRESGTFGATADIGQRFGTQDAFGLRLNVAAEHLDPVFRNASGRRTLAALAGDWRVSPDTLIEAEIETSRQSQPSVPGFSLLGNMLPNAQRIDPRINLNNQPWSLPVVLAGTTGSLRLQQRLSEDWKLVAHAAVQRLRSDDRLAFAFGCGKEGNYDRYCSDGTYDLYDFRSDNERRRNNALDVHAEGRLATGPVIHQIAVGALETRFKLRTQPQVDSNTPLDQSGTIDGLTVVPLLAGGMPLGTIPNSTRTERSTEVYARDRIELTKSLGLWLGLRHSRLQRESVRTDGSQPTDYTQSFTTPWVAASYAWQPDLLTYASWGEGVESAVVPNRPQYTNAGQPLAALKSRQTEVGIKQSSGNFDWGLDWFQITRPQFNDQTVADCGGDGACLTQLLDGNVHSRGVEANTRWTTGNLVLQASAIWLKAEQRNSSIRPDLNGKRPANVPQRSLKLNSVYALGAMPGLSLQAGMVYEGSRAVLPDDSITIPGWTRFDLGAQYQQKVGAAMLTWLVGVDNATDRRAWREAPYQYSHAYLFPLAPRTWRLSLRADV